MYIIFIRNMTLTITVLYLISLLKKYMLLKDFIYPTLYKFLVSFLSGIVVLGIMSEPLFYNGGRFDLRSVPIFIVAYINGWKYGLITALIALFYRIYLGGPTVIEGIIFDILIVLVIGVIGYKKNNQSTDPVIVNVDVKRALLLYLIFIFLTFFVPLLWISTPLLFLFKVMILYTISSLLAVFLSLVLINDFNKDIYRNFIEFSETKEELLEREKELERKNLNVKFFSNISHEFKTPLNLIFSALQMLDKYNEKELKIEDERFKRYLNIIKQNGYRLLRLVDNVIDITRLDVNSFELNLVNEDIVKVVEGIVFSVEEYIKNKNRKLEYFTNVGSKKMAIDPENLERAVLNLISNAVKFTEQGDTISVNIIDRVSVVDIIISDTGIGIDKEKHNFIFELFRQVDESFSRRAEGSGIGLYIVEQIVKLHGGQVWVESEKNIGSKFILRLPVNILTEDKENKQKQTDELIDKIDIEFSDIYNI